jgi:hypothetical protein
MAKARAIVKRRKAVRNIKKITKTMQMIATAKFQKSLKRAVGTKPYSNKVRELVAELAANARRSRASAAAPAGGAGHRTNRIALLVITSNRGLAGAYNGSVLRAAIHFIREQEAAGKKIDLYVAGKKGISYFNFQKRPITSGSISLATAEVRRCRASPISSSSSSRRQSRCGACGLHELHQRRRAEAGSDDAAAAGGRRSPAQKAPPAPRPKPESQKLATFTISSPDAQDAAGRVAAADGEDGACSRRSWMPPPASTSPAWWR